jgi:flagellin
MALYVQYNAGAANANRQLAITTGAQAKSSERLSSGYRINRAGDDAAGLSISEKMRFQARGLTKASSNAQDGISLIQTAEGGLNETHSILQRMNELATQAANDTNVTLDRTAVQTELNQLISEIDRIASTTSFNNKNLLNDSKTTVNLQVGAFNGQSMAVEISGAQSVSLGVAASSISVSSITVANTSMSLIQSAIAQVSERRANLGAYQNRLEHTIANLDTSAENIATAESRIRNTDMAKEMVEYSKNNILAQAGQSMLAQANQSTQGVLSLLQ